MTKLSRRTSQGAFAALLLLAASSALPAAEPGTRVLLGGHAYRIPTAYSGSDQELSAHGPVELTLTAPQMQAYAFKPGIKGAGTLPDLLSQIPVTIEAPEGITFSALLARKVVNDDRSMKGSLERRDPRERLELRVRQPEQLGLTPYTVDDIRMQAYAGDYRARYGKTLTRNPAYEPDWFIARAADGSLATVIQCDQPRAMHSPATPSTDPAIAMIPPAEHAGCIHYFIDAPRALYFQMTYQRRWLNDWKQMEDRVRALMAGFEVK